MKYGIIGWGRACGWMLLGLSQSILWISEQPAGAEQTNKLQAEQPAGAEQADKLQAEQSAAQPSSQSVAREGCIRLLLLQQQLLDSILYGSAQTVDFPGSCRHGRDTGIPQQRG